MVEIPLGKKTIYPEKYQPDLLVGIPRSENRQILGITTEVLPFEGADVWNAYELSYLNTQGKPITLHGRFVFPAGSNKLVESKSLKLYLNSLNQEYFESDEHFASIIHGDLSRAADQLVGIFVFQLNEMSMPEYPSGTCLDDQKLDITDYSISKSLLKETSDTLFEELTEEILYTNLFRSNCPVTNQPDWATVTVCYQGKKIPHDVLLKYLISYRQHNDYHENCVERIFCDLKDVFDPQSLTVEANFLRRGGLDINPIRSTEKNLNYQAFPRFIRQ
jgi:7-cyano-7-deazaguanine reductase